MAKGKFRLRSINKTNNNNNTPSIGQTLLSNFQFGIFGVNKCDSDDDSFYCKFSRFFSIIMMIIMLCIIAYVIYILLKNYIFKSNSYGGKRKFFRK